MIRYVLPVVWMMAQFARWVIYLLGSSTFESEWRFVLRRDSTNFVTKSPINLYKLLLYSNVAMVVLLGGYDGYLLLMSEHLPIGLFCETDHWQTHWTLVGAVAVRIASHMLEAQCCADDLCYERELIMRHLTSPDCPTLKRMSANV